MRWANPMRGAKVFCPWQLLANVLSARVTPVRHSGKIRAHHITLDAPPGEGLPLALDRSKPEFRVSYTDPVQLPVVVIRACCPCTKFPSFAGAICESAIPPIPSSPALNTPTATPGESADICERLQLTSGNSCSPVSSTTRPRARSYRFGPSEAETTLVLGRV